MEKSINFQEVTSVDNASSTIDYFRWTNYLKGGDYPCLEKVWDNKDDEETYGDS